MFFLSVCSVLFCCKQKTSYEMRISDWSSDVCSSDLRNLAWLPRVGDALRDAAVAERDAVENRSAQTVWFNAGHEMPVETKWTWKARTSFRPSRDRKSVV